MDFKKYYKNKTILLTGSSKGLGNEILKSLKNFNCKVILLNRNKTNKFEKNKNFIEINCDLTNLESIRISIEQILKLTKKIDVIFHVAGGGLGLNDPLINSEQFQKVFNLNFLSILEINQMIIPYMIKRKKGNIVHVGSITSYESIGSLSYNISKHALSAYVRTLGKSLALKNIIINGISPGGFIGKNNAMQRLKSKNVKAYNEYLDYRLPRKKMGKAEELVFLMLYLGSVKSSFTSSNLIPIDAGEGNSYIT